MTGCACVYIDTGADEIASFVVTETRRARKTHKCTECGRDIIPAEPYEYTRGLWCGVFETTKTCTDCLSIRDNMFCDGFYYGCLLSDLRTHVFDMQGGISEDCLAGLTPRARAMVCEMIEDVWAETEGPCEEKK